MQAVTAASQVVLDGHKKSIKVFLMSLKKFPSMLSVGEDETWIISFLLQNQGLGQVECPPNNWVKCDKAEDFFPFGLKRPFISSIPSK